MDFFLGGLAATIAGLFTNPFDLIRTRQQLQGELQTGAENHPYKGLIRSMRSIIKSDGLLGLQRGLVAQSVSQFVLNSTRLGLFDTFDKLNLTRDATGNHALHLYVFWSAISGLAGSSIAFPLILVKTQIHAQSSVGITVGYQHSHTGVLNALSNIYRRQGVEGLFKGYLGVIPRTCIGSAIQLTAFAESKSFLSKYQTFKTNKLLTAACASMVSGLFTVIGRTPFDVITTRIYNQGVDAQGKGLLYKNYSDCFMKTVKYEGVRGLYKGFVASYWRSAPHTVLSFTIWDELKILKKKYKF